MTDDEDLFNHGQDPHGVEAYEAFLAEYLRYLTQVLFGPPGRLLAASDVRYEKQHPDHVCVFNANVCIGPPTRIGSGTST